MFCRTSHGGVSALLVLAVVKQAAVVSRQQKQPAAHTLMGSGMVLRMGRLVLDNGNE
jgi:hypothetical protein